MSRVRVDTQRIGAVLAHDLCDIKGRMLMPAGTVLGEEQLRLLRQWHLEVVQVGPDDDEPLHWRDIPLDGLSPALHILHEQHLDELFRFCGRDDECMTALFYFLLDRLDRRSLLEEPPR